MTKLSKRQYDVLVMIENGGIVAQFDNQFSSPRVKGSGESVRIDTLEKLEEFGLIKRTRVLTHWGFVNYWHSHDVWIQDE